MNIADLDIVPPFYLPLIYWSAERADRILTQSREGHVGFDGQKWMDMWEELPGYYTRENLRDYVLGLCSVMEELQKHGYDNSGAARSVYTLIRLVQEGKKVICPNAVQCEQMAEVSVDIPCDDFEMPFPALLVSFPKEYRDQLTAELGHYCPRYLIACFSSDMRVLTLHTTVTRNTHGPYEYGAQFTLRQLATMEDYLGRVEATSTGYDDDQEKSLFYRLARIVMNTALLMVYSGVRSEDQPTSVRASMALARVRAKRKKKDKPKSWYRDLGIGRGEMKMYQFVQQSLPLLDREEMEQVRRQEGDRKPPRPHWRKGHKKRVRCGKGGQERKVVFIERTFVRPEAFSGRLVDTVVHYQDKDEEAA